MPDTWQEQPPAPKGAHYHRCSARGCATYIVCARAADHCAVDDKWVCQSCELDAVDDYLARKIREGEEPPA